MESHAVAGFFYHSRIVAIVHLVTIGWIAMSILGSVYIVLPLACGQAFPARRSDYVAYGFVAIGLIGMVAHFWIAQFSGMAWSAVMAAAGILHVVLRAAVAMRRARVASGVKLHVYLAAANLAGAVTMGVLLGFDKARPFLPRHMLANVFAHAHPRAAALYVSALLFERRILPIASAYWTLQKHAVPAPLPQSTATRVIFVAWVCGVPLIAAGFFVNHAGLLASGAWLLFAGVVLMSFNLIRMLAARMPA